jgi:acetolactate decarboxylase
MKFISGFFFLLFLVACSSREPENRPVVKHAGALRDFTQKNDTSSAIYLDTIDPHRRLYGLGALRGYTGEILVIDGRPYVSKLNSKGDNRVRLSFDLRAPYFVYAHVKAWDPAELPDKEISSADLEAMLPELAKKAGLDPGKPFPFMLRGAFGKLAYHIDYRPKKNKKRMPQTAFAVSDADIIILGFYSKQHQDIFTTAGSNVTMSFMTTSADLVGQIDQLSFQGKKVQLLLPE